jgi:predicted pyridoxine 5'-phosphate oxidase superfamily flavin-nucleotide-binding protein
MNYHKLAFTDAVKAIQAQNGSLETYDRVAKKSDTPGLSPNEVAFIEDRDSFYMATVGQNGFPYIQHRGGPKGFLKVLDDQTLGFVDFSGNRQYISTGNLKDNDAVALFLVSYPHRARLKLYARARVVELTEDPDLFAKLDPEDYGHTPERMIIFEVQAYDWNCPQHLTQRFSQEEVEHAFAPQLVRLEELEAENKRLRALVNA